MRNVLQTMSKRVLDREIMNCFRLIQTTVQAVFNYLSDRIHVLSRQLRERIRLSASMGLDECVSAIQQYTVSVGEAALQWNDNERLVDDVDNLKPFDSLKWHMARLLHSCRKALQSFLMYCRSHSTEEDSSDEEIEKFLTMVGRSSRIIEELRRDVVDLCCSKSILTSDRKNADVLAMYLE
jgi:hypothetical protein